MPAVEWHDAGGSGNEPHHNVVKQLDRLQAADVAGFAVKNNRFTAELTAALQLSVKNHEHLIRGIALMQVYIARREKNFLRLAEEPFDLIVRQISEHRQASKF